MAKILGRTKPKHPSEIFLVPITFRKLGANTLVGGTVSVEPATLTVSISDVDDNRVVIECSGGVDGTDYTITPLIDVSNGEIRAPMFKMKVEIPI